MYPLPGNPNLPLPPRILRNLPPSEPVECLVRVYVIKVGSKAQCWDNDIVFCC